MGWLKKAFKKVNNIARKIDPIGHKVVDKVVAQDSRNVRSLAKLFGGSADGKGWASSLYREADRNVADPQWALAKAAIATAAAYGGMAAYGAYAGGAGAGAGVGTGTLGGGITGTGGASGMAAYGAEGLGSYLGTAGTGSLGAGTMGAGASTLGGVGGALGAGYYGGALAPDGIMAANAAQIGPSTLGQGNWLQDKATREMIQRAIKSFTGGDQPGGGGGGSGGGGGVLGAGGTLVPDDYLKYEKEEAAKRAQAESQGTAYTLGGGAGADSSALVQALRGNQKQLEDSRWSSPYT